MATIKGYSNTFLRDMVKRVGVDQEDLWAFKIVGLQASAREIMNRYRSEYKGASSLTEDDISNLGSHNNIFPALDIQMNLWSMATSEHEYGNTTLKYPTGTSSFGISVTALDDERGSIENFFEAWVNQDILARPGTVRPLKSCYKKLTCYKLNRQKQVVRSWNHLVIPDGSYDFTGNAGSGEVKNKVFPMVSVGSF